MSLSDTDAEFAKELFSGLGALTSRKMMGGLCLYLDGTIFAIVHGDGSIWLKAAAQFTSELKAAGSRQWTYQRNGGKETAMPYWSLPESALDDPETACDWAKRALTHLK